MRLSIPIRAVSELNERGLTRGAALGRAARKKKQREATHYVFLGATQLPAAPWTRKPALPCKVTLTRVAPRPLDSHDNLAASLKSVVDQLAIELGLPVNAKGHAQDSDPRVTWAYAQRKGGVREYAVEVEIDSTAAARSAPESSFQVKEAGPDVPRGTLQQEVP